MRISESDDGAQENDGTVFEYRRRKNKEAEHGRVGEQSRAIDLRSSSRRFNSAVNRGRNSSDTLHLTSKNGGNRCLVFTEETPPQPRGPTLTALTPYADSSQVGMRTFPHLAYSIRGFLPSKDEGLSKSSGQSKETVSQS